MAKKIIDFESTCEGCGKPVKMSREVDVPDAPTLDQIHSTLNEAADELFDCPECSQWIAKTSQKHKVSPIEEEPKQPTFEFGGLRPKESE